MCGIVMAYDILIIMMGYKETIYIAKHDMDDHITIPIYVIVSVNLWFIFSSRTRN